MGQCISVIDKTKKQNSKGESREDVSICKDLKPYSCIYLSFRISNRFVKISKWTRKKTWLCARVISS